MSNILFKEYSIFCIGKIWVDWPGMDLPFYPKSSFRPSEPYLSLGWYGGVWVLHGAHHSFGLGEWDVGPISLPPSAAPQPLCMDCVGKGCNSSCNGFYFHVSAWKRAN